jgi:hypothetical protein
MPEGFRWNSEKSKSLCIIVEMLFIEYQSMVLQEYERRRVAGDLSLRMHHLSPARLREECEVVCNLRYDRKDDKTLEGFFGQGGEKKDWLKAIRWHDTDKFRPLQRFMNGEIKNPGPKNVELLAWLIDFTPRPFESAERIDVKNPDIPDCEQDKLPKNDNEIKEEAKPTEDPVQVAPEEAPASTRYPKPLRSFGRRKVVIAAIILAALVIGIPWIWPGKSFVLIGPQGCMYWTGDHYQQVRCDQKIDGVQVIALDSAKLISFTKITRPDTITSSSIGKVWYVRFNGNYEYYTSGGFHPIDQRLRLKPLTDYILFTHGHPAQ